MKQIIVSVFLLVSLLLGGCVTVAPPPAAIEPSQSAAAATSTPENPPAEPADATTPALTDTPIPTNTVILAAETQAPADSSTPEVETPDGSDTPVPAPETPIPVDLRVLATLTPSELFDKVSPSVAFVETDRSSGSGVLIEDGYVVTNAHVVWPFSTVRVVFPDGSEFKDAPVLAWDLIADLAVVGPLETELSPVTFLTDERLLVGKDVFLIGYPGEVEKFPQPTISRGLVSRLRTWPAIDVTYLQTDATIAGGQSGGVLVTDRGEVAGISGNTFPDTSFALAASAQDVDARIQRLLAGEDIDGLGQRPVLDEEGANTTHMVVLGADSPSSTYALHGEKGDEVDVSVEAIPNLAIWVVDSYGEPVAWADNSYTGKEQTTFELDDTGLYFIDVFNLDGGAAVGTIKSNAVLTPLKDFDDRSRPTVGKTIAGALDYPTDIDPYRLYLEQGQEINIRVESVMIDPLVAVHMHEIDAEEKNQPADGNSGDGLFGLDAEMSYRAPESDVYFILVASQVPDEAGGYLLTVREVQEGDPTPMAPKPTPAPIPSDLGPMTIYESEDVPGFRMQVPLDWTEGSPTRELNAICETVAYCRYTADGEVVFFITEQPISNPSPDDAALESYAAEEERFLNAFGGNAQVVRSDKIVTQRGVPVHVLEYDYPVGVLKVVNFMAVHKGTAFKLTVMMPAAWEDADEETARYIRELHEYADLFAGYMINTLQVVG